MGVLKDLAAGSIGGTVSIFCCHPLDTVRTRLQVDNMSTVKGQRLYRGAWDCLQKTVKHEGVRGLYKGMASPLAAQGFYKAVMFGSFGFASRGLQKIKQLRHSGERTGKRPGLTLPDTVLCGAFAGTVNTLVLSPIELIRNRLMIQSYSSATLYTGVVDCVQKVVRNEGGVLALWKGWSATVLRDGPGVGVWFGAFECARRELAARGHTGAGALLLAGACGGIAFWFVALPFDAIKSHLQTNTAAASNLTAIRSIILRKGPRELYRGMGVALTRGIPGAAIVFLVQRKSHDILDKWFPD